MKNYFTRLIFWGVLFFIYKIGFSQTGFHFPEKSFVPGWKAGAQAEYYTNQTLSIHLDGAAEIFLEFGMQKLYFQTYTKNNSEIDVSVFRMNSQSGALGIFLMQKGPGENLSQLPPLNMVSRYQLLFTAGPYFVSMLNTTGNAHLLSALTACALALYRELAKENRWPSISRFPLKSSTAAGNADQEEILYKKLLGPLREKFPQLLPEQNLIKNSVRLICGPLSARGFGLDALLSALNISSRNPALAGKYMGPSSKKYNRMVYCFRNQPALKRTREKITQIFPVKNLNKGSFSILGASGKKITVEQNGLCWRLRIE